MAPLPDILPDVEAGAPVPTSACDQVEVAQPCNAEHMAPTNGDDQEVPRNEAIDHELGTSDTPHIDDILPLTQRKRKNNRSTADRGPTALPKYRGTGFEEFYADPPMTPGEALEERLDIYFPERPFYERIEECIQRYRARRRMKNDTTVLFNKYLFLGGIDCSPRQFTGIGNVDSNNATADEMREASAIDKIHQSSGGSMYYTATMPEHWDVDFTGVVSGFLSETVPTMTGWNYERMGKAVGVVDNFLRYILHHDVCPEYEEDIKEAIEICACATVDLPMTHQCLIQFPGQFNLAAAELYCKDTFSFWNVDHGFQRPEYFDAERVFKAAISLLADDDEYTRMCKASSIFVVDEIDCDMEVVAVHRPSKDISKLFRSIRDPRRGKARHAAIGKVVLKPCIIENGWDHGDLPRPIGEVEQTFFLDDAILARMQPGFKLQLIICKLNIGIKFIKNASSVFVPWYTFLPQELMYRYKEPKPNYRPAPSVHDPELEEREEEKEFKEG